MCRVSEAHFKLQPWALFFKRNRLKAPVTTFVLFHKCWFFFLSTVVTTRLILSSFAWLWSTWKHEFVTDGKKFNKLLSISQKQFKFKQIFKHISLLLVLHSTNILWSPQQICIYTHNKWQDHVKIQSIPSHERSLSNTHRMIITVIWKIKGCEIICWIRICAQTRLRCQMPVLLLLKRSICVPSNKSEFKISPENF